VLILGKCLFGDGAYLKIGKTKREALVPFVLAKFTARTLDRELNGREANCYHYPSHWHPFIILDKHTQTSKLNCTSHSRTPHTRDVSVADLGEPPSLLLKEKESAGQALIRLSLKKFSLNCQRLSAFCLAFTRSTKYLVNWHHFVYQLELHVKPQRMLSQALCQLHPICAHFDWFAGLSESSVIG